MPKVTPKDTWKIIGIDPGKTGGITVMTPLNDWGEVKIDVHKMPLNPRDIYDLLASLGKGEAWLEQVHSMPNDSKGNVFTFGRGVGGLEMACTAVGFRLRFVTPVAWQKPFNLLRKCKSESTTQKKHRHLAKVKELYPELKVTLKTCDSVLIAEHGRRLVG